MSLTLVGVYLLLLPAATWLLGSLLSLLDLPEPAPALRRVAWSGLPFLGVALLLGSAGTVPILAALVTSPLLHAGWTAGVQLAVRRRWLITDPEDRDPEAG